MVKSNRMKKVILLAGAGGSGKSTLAELIQKKYGYTLLDGDHEDTEFFPKGGQWLPENADKLSQAHNKIVGKVQVLVEDGQNVVVDYIIFGDYLNYFEKFKRMFGEDLQIVVLFPSEAQTVNRDLERECWTTGEDKIRKVRQALEGIKDQIGAEHFVDTSDQSVEQTFEMLFGNQ